MNKFYTRESNTISKKQEGIKIKSEPSDMVIQNILNYSRALDVMKSNRKNKMETIQIILN